MSKRARSGWFMIVGLLATFSGGRPVLAQVMQTDAAMTPLPQPVPMAEASLINDSWAWNSNTLVNRDPIGVILNSKVRYGDFYAPPNYPQFVTGDAINLSGLFKWRKEAIDPIKDARTGPGYFSPQAGFTGQLLLMGGSCQAQFGWYNVTDPVSKTPPLATEVYPFISGKPQDQLNCVEGNGTTRKTDGFCPLAWDNRDPYNLSITRWTPKVFPSGDIAVDPRYKGGYVAFAVIGDPQRCPQTKYSMYEHNQRNANNVPWVTSLIYQSKVDPTGFYMAFEDLPMSAADWRKTTSGGSGADGDFNDLVFYVSGLVDGTCAGKICPSGQSCQLGLCIDPCLGVACPGQEVCSNGACVPPTMGAGGSGGGSASGGTSGTGIGGMGEAGEAAAGSTFAGGAAGAEDEVAGASSAGEMNARGGASGTSAVAGASAVAGTSAVAGASAAGGVVMPGVSDPESSSGCGCAVPASEQSPRVWTVLGLAIGLGLMRRRRRTL